MRYRHWCPSALRHLRLVALVALLLALAATTAAPARTAPAKAAQTTRVRVAFFKGLGDAPLVLARANGYFAAEGIETELADFGFTADALPALATGQIVALTGGLNPAIFNAVARGVDMKVVADGGSLGPDADWFALVVRRVHVDSGRYRGPADLRGLRIAVPAPYTIVHYVLKVLLERNGLSLADVDVQPLPLPDQAGAVNNGAVDAAFTIEPFITQAVGLGGAVRVVGAQEVTPNLAGAITAYSPDFATRTPELADRYMVAWLRGVADYNAAFGAERRGTDAAVQLLREAGIPINPNTQLPRFQPDGRFDVGMMSALLDWYIAEGVVPAGTDLGSIIDFQFADRAARRLGVSR
jgi:NitT/TauT family transport system substrate-binding protein